MTTLTQEKPKTNIEDIINQGPKIPQLGQTMEGVVIKTGKGAVLIDLGAAGMGMILGREIQENPDVFRQLKPQDKVTAKVIDLENDKGFVEVSLAAANKESGWEKLAKKMQTQEIVEAQVIKANRGGLLVEVEGLQGFLPASQLSQKHYPKVSDGNKNQIMQQLQTLINKKLKVKIIDLEPRELSLIVSEKALEQDKIKKILTNYQAGQIIEGTISHLTNFGAFIQFSALSAKNTKDADHILEGLIHISELDWGPVEDPSKIVQVGQKVKAQIVDIKGGRVSLSLKTLKKDPWQDLDKKYQPGQTVQGKVRQINRFGAFVLLANSIQGLVPTIEFRQLNKEIQDVVQLGEERKFKIISLDTKAHRLALGLA